MTPTALLTVAAPAAADPFVSELDELAGAAPSLPPGVVDAVRAVLEAMLADELEGPEREAALRTLEMLAERH